MMFHTFFAYEQIGKMIVMEVAMNNPPPVFIAVLLFCPSFELFPYKCSHFSESPLCTNTLVIIRPMVGPPINRTIVTEGYTNIKL